MPRELSQPEPSALKWARSASGFDLSEVALKMKMDEGRISAWELGAERPSFPQLRKLASVYKRPMAIFYLEDLPSLPADLIDFRNRDRSSKPRTSELTFEIRKARDRRDWLDEMRRELRNPIPKFGVSLSISTDVEQASSLIRKALKVSLPEQTKWSSDYDAFGGWREKVEKAGIACFQARNVSVKECRGFSLSDGNIPTIVTNIKESPRGRLFTLLHELTHICLHESGICDLSDNAMVEAYCNRVAGAIIFPRVEILEFATVKRHPVGKDDWADIELQSISRSFGGSREAALVRLLSLGLTSQSFYDRRREEFRREYEQIRESAGFVPPHKVELSCAGGLFTSTVLESLERNNITLADASTYLHIGFRHLGEADRTAARFEGGIDE